MKFLGFAVLTASLLLAACSNRVREVDIGRSPEEAASFLDRDLGVTAQSSSDAVAAIQSFKNDPDTKIFYAEAPGAMGTPENVTPIEMELLAPGLYLDQVVASRAYFLVRADGNVFDAALVIWVKLVNGQEVSRAFANTEIAGEILDEEMFEILLTDSQGQEVIVRSYDLDSDKIDMAETIQLELSSLLPDGSEIDRGKISTMGQL